MSESPLKPLLEQVVGPYRVAPILPSFTEFSLPELIRQTAEASRSPIWFSLVLPTYNEAENIGAVVDKLCGILDGVLSGRYELIIVDDNSPDSTWKIAQKLMNCYSQLRVIRRRQERGLSGAVIRGWQSSRGVILGVIDADLQHPPDSILQLLGKICLGADLAVASRYASDGGVSDWNFARRFLSRGAQILGLILLPGTMGKVSDPMSGYFVVKRTAIADCTLYPVGYKILIEILARGEIGRIAEVSYIFQERLEGSSKVTWRQYKDYIHHLLRLRFDLWPFGRFIRFGIVGLSGVFVDMTVLYLLSDPATLGWGLTRSKLVAGELAILNNFIWNDRWTFRDYARRQKGWNYAIVRLCKFNIICSIGLAINVVTLNLVFNFLLPDRYIANLIAIAVTTLWNFWVNLKLNWRTTLEGCRSIPS